MVVVSTKPAIKEVVSLENALSMTGYGCFNLFVLFATGGCLMAVVIETMNMMIIIPAAQCDLNLTLYQKGILSSISFFGVVSSSYPAGYIADTKGRKNVLIISLLVSAISSFICSIIPWSWLFILLRFVNGFFIGGASAVVYAFAGEFHDNRYRPKIITWMAVFVAFGSMFIAGIAWIILPQEWSYEIPSLGISFKPWRFLVIIYALPSIVFAACICILPESPKYLLTQKKNAKVLDILKKMYYFNTHEDPDNNYLVAEVTWDELGEDISGKNYTFWVLVWKQITPIFKGTFLIKTVMVSMLHFGIFGANAGIMMWYPEILNIMSHYAIEKSNDFTVCEAMLYDADDESNLLNLNDTNITEKICKDDVKPEVFAISLYVAIAYACVYLFIGSVINIFGKKKLIIGFLTVTAIIGFSTQFVYGYTPIQILIGIVLMGGAGIGIVNAIIVDLYPTQIRAMALSVSLMFGRVGAVAGSNLIGPIIYNYCNSLFYIIAADQILLIIIVIFLPSSQKLPKVTQS